MIQLYYKTVSKGGKPTYHALTPDSSGAESYELTNRQAITVAVSMVYPITMGLLDKMPEHKRASREIKRMLLEMLNLLKGTGEEIDDELAEHLLKAWNIATHIGQLTDYERAES